MNESELGYFESEMKADELNVIASKGNFYSYVAGTVAVLLDMYSSIILSHDLSVDIFNNKTTLPTKKGSKVVRTSL